MNEHDFDALLENALPEQPPDDIVSEVTPWRSAIKRVLTGLALCAITLNFLGLGYILPSAGMILLLLGFRTLRGENRALMACWVLSVLRTVLHFSIIILNATIYHSAVYESGMGRAMEVVNAALLLTLIVCFWRGIAGVQKKAGTDSRTGSAAALLVWYAVLILLVIADLNGQFLAIMMVVFYILIIRSLYRLSKDMEESGFAIEAAPVRISDKTLVWTIVALVLAGICCGYLFFGSYRMDWQAEVKTQSAEVSEIRNTLLSLGYPQAALEDLSDEDILACRGALRVVTQELVSPDQDDAEGLRFTDVAVELPGEKPNWRIFHHFIWTESPGFYGTETLQIWPAYQDSDGWAAAGGLTGRVLYDKDSAVFTAPFYSLIEEDYTKDTILWGTRDTRDIFADFSFPRGGERYRGYVSYCISERQPGWIVNSWINYVHQESPLQYPAKTASEHRKSGKWRSQVFVTVQNALQFYVLEDGIDLFSS